MFLYLKLIENSSGARGLSYQLIWICARFFYTRLFAILAFHDDVIKWKHFPHYWPFVRRIQRSPVNSPHGQWHGALVFSLICTRINGWAYKWWGWWVETPPCPLWRRRNVAQNSHPATRNSKYMTNSVRLYDGHLKNMLIRTQCYFFRCQHPNPIMRCWRKAKKIILKFSFMGVGVHGNTLLQY